MDKVKAFFENLADEWDSINNVSKDKINEILELTDLTENKIILDLGCGTGILEEYLLKYNPKKIIAVDIAQKMILNAKQKYKDEVIEFLCGDILKLECPKVDYAIIHNAFPHFFNPEEIVERIFELLNENGKLIICHSFGRKKINNHHKEKANEVSLGLKAASELIKILDDFHIEKLIDSKEIYLIYAMKKK